MVCDKCNNKSSFRIKTFNYSDLTVQVHYACSVCDYVTDIKAYDLKGKFVEYRKVVNKWGVE